MPDSDAELVTVDVVGEGVGLSVELRGTVEDAGECLERSTVSCCVVRFAVVWSQSDALTGCHRAPRKL